MKPIISFLIVCSFAFTACNNHPSKNGDAEFQKMADEYMKGYLNWRPQFGVQLGLHEYDGKVTDYSKASIDAELARMKEFEKSLLQLIHRH